MEGHVGESKTKKTNSGLSVTPPLLEFINTFPTLYLLERRISQGIKRSTELRTRYIYKSSPFLYLDFIPFIFSPEISEIHLTSEVLPDLLLQSVSESNLLKQRRHPIQFAMPLTRWRRISISVTKGPLALSLPNFNITHVAEYRQKTSRSVPQMLLLK